MKRRRVKERPSVAEDLEADMVIGPTIQELAAEVVETPTAKAPTSGVTELGVRRLGAGEVVRAALRAQGDTPISEDLVVELPDGYLYPELTVETSPSS